MLTCFFTCLLFCLFISVFLHLFKSVFLYFRKSMFHYFCKSLNDYWFTTAKEYIKIHDFSYSQPSGRGWPTKWQGLAILNLLTFSKAPLPLPNIVWTMIFRIKMITIIKSCKSWKSCENHGSDNFKRFYDEKNKEKIYGKSRSS